MSTYKAVILKGKNHIKEDGTSNIKIRLTHNRKADYISTDLYVIPDTFDEKAGVVKSGKNKGYINLRITDKLREYQNLDLQLGDRKLRMDVKELKSTLISGNINKQVDFFEFAIEHIGNIDSEAHKRNVNSFINILKNFSGEKLEMSQISYPFLVRFEKYLRRKGVRNGVNNYMRYFRSIFNKARDYYNDEDSGIIVIPNYPFRKYQIPKPKLRTREHYLTVKELKKLIRYAPENNGEQFAKDMFLIMFYLIGIEAKDLFFLNKPRKGRIYYDRYKTGKEYSIKLEPEALEIINRYKGRDSLLNISERFKLHESLTRKVNNYLHGEKHHKITGIFEKLKIEKRVTTKWARHTWATIARNDCRIDKDDVALCLGHEDADNKVTDIYIRYDYSIIDESNRKVLDLFK